MIYQNGVTWDFVVVRRWGCLVAIVLVLTACAKRQTLPVENPHPPISSTEISDLSAALETIAYTIQLGAFESSLRAERLVQRLQDEGVDAYFYEDKGGLTKVRFGKFDSGADARNHAVALKAKGIIDEFYIVQPRQPKQLTQKEPHYSLGQRLVKTAEEFIGIPYRWGGTSVEKGFDCSGLTMTVYRLNGLDLPRKASSQYQAGQPVSRSALKYGDLVFFATNGDNRISHVGIYSGEGTFIHAPGRGKHIRTSILSNDYYSKHYRGARRYF